MRADLALEALPADLDADARTRAVLEQVLVFTPAVLAAVYLPDDSGDALHLSCSAGVPCTLCGLADRYPAAGAAPVAVVHRSGGPLWPAGTHPAGAVPAEPLEPGGTGAETAARQWSFAVLPLGAGRPGQGCLLAVGRGTDGFDAPHRYALRLCAAAIGERPAPAPGPPAAPAEPAAGTFALAMDSGRIDADAHLLELFGLTADAFDGRVETLLARTVPADLPAVLSAVRPGHLAGGGRELDFRVGRPAGEPRWLRLRGRVLPAGGGLPLRLLGTVADTCGLRPRAADVVGVQRLAAALAAAGSVQEAGRALVAALRDPLGANRVALAQVASGRLLATVLDPAEHADPAAPSELAEPPESPEPSEPPEPAEPAEPAEPSESSGSSEPAVWRGLWGGARCPRGPDVRTLPTVSAALEAGRPVFRPAGAVPEAVLARVAPGGLAVLPLSAAGRTVGVCLVGWDEPHVPGPAERALLTAVAALAGPELARVRALDAEHASVGLRRGLLPRDLPELPGGRVEARHLPSTAGAEAGGDWYDVIVLPDSHVALVIGAVQGHDAGAAALTGQLRTALRAYAVEGHPPDVVVSHANRLLAGTATDLFATCAYIDVDMAEGTAWCVRAGHLPPVLRGPDGGAEPVRGEGGPPLGVLAEADFPMTPFRLQPGALLALATDGLLGPWTRDPDDGLRQLGDRLAGRDPAHLAALADALLAGGESGDDVALLLLRYDGTALRPLRESWTIWRVPEASGHARRFVRRTLRAWGVRREVDTVLLVVSELVTNALVHTEGQVLLELTLIGDRLRVGVGDASPRSPVRPASIGWEATGGRGILLVQAVSAAWGTLPVSGGKRVWSEIVVG